MPTRVRRTQRERTETTTKALVSAARDLFVADGFAGTSLNAICGRAGVSRGAFYHHFQSKEDIFRAVFAIEMRKLSTAVRGTFQRYEDPWVGVLEGAKTLLEASLEPEVRRLTQIEAPSALGWADIRDLQAHCRRQLRTGLAMAVQAGCIPDHPLDPLTSFIYGGIGELTLDTAHADDDENAVSRAFGTLTLLLSGITGTGAESCPHHGR